MQIIRYMEKGTENSIVVRSERQSCEPCSLPHLFLQLLFNHN